ncbi:cyclin-dependent kinase inhibitor 1C-like [Metopolophium dirhodum]|uniref:cyclin-dependent kinase inhibitor 1C-like n=1 Tax=Metopolophium dirhodum TaxID=44670 RepID=UPI0029906F0F|nr:cyclin-dependent kinase inhibitor 1C-like [Metopolophium dirhodum]
MSIKMSLFAIVACCLVATSVAAPSGLAPAPLVAAAPVVAAPVQPVVTAYSSQYVARNYNGIAVAPAVVPSAAVVGYPAPAPIYAPAAYAYPSPLVQDYLF